MRQSQCQQICTTRRQQLEHTWWGTIGSGICKEGFLLLIMTQQAAALVHSCSRRSDWGRCSCRYSTATATTYADQAFVLLLQRKAEVSNDYN